MTRPATSRALTTKDLTLLREVDPSLAVFVQGSTKDYARKLSALRKATTIMRAEREALQEMLALGLLREGAGNLLALKTRLDAAEAKAQLVAGDNHALRRKIESVTARPAMAVSGD